MCATSVDVEIAVGIGDNDGGGVATEVQIWRARKVPIGWKRPNLLWSVTRFPFTDEKAGRESQPCGLDAWGARALSA